MEWRIETITTIIQEHEFKEALKKMSNAKLIEPDNLLVEVQKILRQVGVEGESP